MNTYKAYSPFGIWLVVIFITAIGRSFTMLSPGVADAQLFAVLGQWWADGGRLYVDMWDNKPPGIFLVNAVTFKFLPANFTSIACVEFIFVLTSACTLWNLLKKVNAPGDVIVLGMVMYALASNLSLYNEGGNLTEIYVLLPSMLSINFFLRGWTQNKYPIYILMAGFFSGVAFLFKPPAFTVFMAILIFLIFNGITSRNNFVRASKSAALLAAGAICVFSLVAIYFYEKDAFISLFEATLTHNLHYGRSSGTGFVDGTQKLIEGTKPILSFIVLAGFGIALTFLRTYFSFVKGKQDDIQGHENAHALWLISCVWFLLDIVNLIAAGRWYGHYFLLLIPSLIILAASSYWKFKYSSDYSKVPNSIWVVILVFIIATPGSYFVLDVLKLDKTYSKDIAPHSADSVVLYLNSHVQAGDTLVTWSYLPIINFKTHMKSPVRFLSLHYLNDSAWAYERFSDEIYSALRKTPPTYIVDDMDQNLSRIAAFSYKRFSSLLQTKYELVETIKSNGHIYRIYRLSTRH